MTSPDVSSKTPPAASTWRLRHGGALLTLDAAGTILERRFACSEPRGVAYEAATDTVHVACSTGELVSFPAAGGAASRIVRVDRDLRDVIVSGSELVLTRFKTAEIIMLDSGGNIVSRAFPPTVPRFDGGFGGGLPPDQGGSSSRLPRRRGVGRVAHDCDARRAHRDVPPAQGEGLAR